MSNANRFIKGFTDVPRCLICGDVEENVENIRRSCLAAILVWRKLGMSQGDIFNSMPFRLWLLNNLDESNKGFKEGWSITFAFTAWWNWKWRNAKFFEIDPSIPIKQAAFVLAHIGEYMRTISPGKGCLFRTTHDHKKEILVR